jgi:biotin synthase
MTTSPLGAAGLSVSALRHDWPRGEVESIYRTPLPSLVFRAQTVHRRYHPEDRVQTCQLLSIKTGGCPEDCGYCPQSAHYDEGVGREGLLDPTHVIEVAKEAAGRGVTRFCMGAAWRQAPEGKEFQKVLEMVRGVSALGLEVCCTLGMLNEKQAEGLKEAGLSAYNHNLDTSPEFYGSIITTRVYDDRLKTLAAVRKAGITVCCGGILGMGEKEDDRIGLLQQLAILNPHPESVPINMLVRVAGTPLAKMPPLDPLDMVRAIATARILMPASRVRLAAGRKQLSPEAVTLCFLAGANSIFVGEKLLTTPNPGRDEDQALLESLGMKPLESHAV